MATYFVPKTGMEMADGLHALGLAVLAAETFNTDSTIEDRGVCFEITAPKSAELTISNRSLDDILALPTGGTLDEATDLQLANFDGLLAASLTTPGVRLVSVADARTRVKQEPDSLRNGIRKCKALIGRLQKYIEKHVECQETWSNAVLEGYTAAKYSNIALKPKQTSDISIPLTLDPAFGYATRQPLSDGEITARSNVAIEGAAFAAILLYVGAARALRAQRVGDGKLVNYYVPALNRMVVQANFYLRCLPHSSHSSRRASLGASFVIWRANPGAMKGISVQVLQTQKAKQSISIEHKCISFSRLNELGQRGFMELLLRWHSLLRQPPDKDPFDLDDLVDTLHDNSSAAFRRHMADAAWHRHAKWNDAAIYYDLEEAKVMAAMTLHANSAMAVVLARDHGTVRFGHALRLLRDVNDAETKEIIEVLDTVKTRDQLIRALARSAQACQLAKAKSDFIIIPTDDDLSVLLDDIEQFGARDIAGLIIILAALRYPSQSPPPTSTPVQMQTPPALEVNNNA